MQIEGKRGIKRVVIMLFGSSSDFPILSTGHFQFSGVYVVVGRFTGENVKRKACPYRRALDGAADSGQAKRSHP